MTQTFNLLRERWLPCLQRDGTVREFSLRDALMQASDLLDIIGETPLQTMALYRLLLAILHRVFGPENDLVWAELWRDGWNSAEIDQYLNEWSHRFDLFDTDRPFYQASNLELSSQPISVKRMFHQKSHPNTLFDHQTLTGLNITPASAARQIVTIQAFGLCGLSGAFTIPEKTGGKKSQGSFGDAPLARGISFMAQGNMLFETLMLNLIEYGEETEAPIPHSTIALDGDLPSWERDDPHSSVRDPLTGYLDYLTWQNRRVRLFAETIDGQLWVTALRWEPATRMSTDKDATFRDPQKHYRVRSKKTLYGSPLLFREDRALWRDSTAILAVRNFRHATENRQKVEAIPPYLFEWLTTLVDEKHLARDQIYHIRALGMASKPGQAVVYFFRDERLPLPLAYLAEPETFAQFQAALEIAEKARGSLRSAAFVVGQKMFDLTDETTRWMDKTGFEAAFWTALNTPFTQFVLGAPKEPNRAMLEWQNELRTSAENAFHALQHHINFTQPTRLTRKAYIAGRRKLYAELKKHLPRPKEVTA